MTRIDPFIVVGDWLAALPIYLLNGLLAILYGLVEAGAALTSLASAALIIRLVDSRVQANATFRPGRLGRESAPTGYPTAQITTGIVLLLWLAGQWGMSAPVPWIGAAMWLVGALAVLAVRLQETTLLWSVKSGIALYALAVLGSRIYLAYTAQLTADQWAALIGSAESAAAVIANTRGNITTIILWALWLVIPLGYFAMLLQQLLIHPHSLVHPLASASERIDRLRRRR